MICELRPALSSDEPFLREMLYLALFTPPGEPPFPRPILDDPAIARYVSDWGTQTGDSGLIALMSGVPVGAAWLRCFPASNPGYGFVDEDTPELSIALLPAHRGHGIGTLLLERLLDGLPAASLSCDPANPARTLYLRLGFRPIGEGRKMLRSSSLSTPRLTLQPLSPRDATDLFAVRGDPEAMAFWDWPADANPAETGAVVEQMLSDAASGHARFWTLRLRSGNSFVGLCDLSEIHARKSADIGFMLVRRFQGLGLAREAVVCVLEQARAMGMKSVHARIHSANRRSARLLERTGFKLVGTDPGVEIRPGVLRDCSRFEITL